MKRFCIALAAAGAVASSASAADPAHPVVVELFQSQGCSDCPPAEANLNAIAGRPDVLALSFGVTYWDQLGWKDTFAKPAFTARQWDYAHAEHHGEVYTPQMIVNGRGALIGSNPQQVQAALAQYDRGAGGPTITASAREVTVGRGASAFPATVWLVRYDPRTLDVPIRAGENGGRTLPHRDIVRSLQALGAWSGAPVSLPLPPSDDPELKTAVLVQEGKAGPILAAARL